MPIYEYECANCGHELELFQKITDKPAKICPSCGKRKLSRLISNTSFQLKGTGWYVTDYANKTKPTAGASKPSSSASKKTDSKPASD